MPSLTARVERADSYRARSASKKGTWPLSPILLRPRVARAWGIIRLPLRFVSEFPLGDLTPSAEHSQSLTLGPAATHAPTDLGELGQAHLPG